MKILRITGFVNNNENGIEISELEAKETSKNYIIKQSLRKRISKNELKQIKTIFKNTIDPNFGISRLSFHSYCLDNEDDKKEIINTIKLKINRLIYNANEQVSELIENRFKDVE